MYATLFSLFVISLYQFHYYNFITIKAHFFCTYLSNLIIFCTSLYLCQNLVSPMPVKSIPFPCFLFLFLPITLSLSIRYNSQPSVFLYVSLTTYAISLSLNSFLSLHLSSPFYLCFFPGLSGSLCQWADCQGFQQRTCSRTNL